jgi:membrane protein implicated in regulation of membrane protease activity
MGLAYLFALVVALGVLLVQIAAGGRDAHHDIGAGHAALGQAASGHAAPGQGAPGHATHGPLVDGEPALWTLFLSLRFWTFFALGFGLSGSLLHFLSLATPLATVLVAALAGLASGLFAALVFRMVGRSAANTVTGASQAVGRVGRVLVPCGPGLNGQVRVEIGGGSVDLRASSDDESIARGEAVLVEDVRDDVARVSRRPTELS